MEADYKDFKEIDSNSQKCPGCGSNLEFDPSTQNLVCSHCGYTKEIFKQNTTEKDFSQLYNDTKSTWSNEIITVKCENCGAIETTKKTSISRNCSFCGSPNLVEQKNFEGRKPDSVQPFKVVQKDALDKAVTWAKKSYWSPGSFKRAISTYNVSGIYYPVFTFDTNAVTYYAGVLGKTEYYRDSKGNTHSRIRYFNIAGQYKSFHDDVTVQASNFIAQKYISKLLPFDTNHSLEYKDEFLYNFNATQYTKDGLVCWKEADTVIQSTIKSAILRKYSYDTIRSYNQKSHYSNQTFKYVLIPLWVGNYTYKEKLYNYFINGVSAKITGHRPVSAVKVLVHILVIIAVIVGIVLALYYSGVFSNVSD
ncbi:MAG: TFIIB-type zinc ribbon-containing protein [Acholeplasmatales bacterium]|jgi:DNA-directed RNA polymerase subunit M/transcription elongation factor TFIIS|nr:TFIIB-type zinc ribbon-containing protein [Acholeplasmatales bacterium]